MSITLLEMALNYLVVFCGIALTVNRPSDAKLSNDDKKPPSEIESLRQIVGALSRQVMLQQLFVEERIRSDGNSGVKQLRLGSERTRNSVLRRNPWHPKKAHGHPRTCQQHPHGRSG